MSRRSRIATLAALVVAALPLAHCKEPTAIRLVISTNVPWVEGSRVAIYATSTSNVEIAGAQSLQEQWGARGADGAAQVGTITVVPTAGDASAGAIRVVMGIGRDPDTCRLDSTQKEGCIVARRKLSFVPGQVLDVPIRLHAVCNGQLCDADTTCNATGVCVSARLDSSKCGSPGGCEPEGDGPSNLPAPSRDASVDVVAPDGSLPLDGSVVDGSGPGDGATGDASGTDSGATDAGQDAGGTDAGQDAGGDAGTDGGSDAGGGGGGVDPGTYSPCTSAVGVDTEAAWPTAFGCADNSNSTRLDGPHVLPTKRNIAVQSAPGAFGPLLAGRVTGNTLRVYLPQYGIGFQHYNVPLAGGAPTFVFTKQLNELFPTTGAALGAGGVLYAKGGGANAPVRAFDPTTGDALGTWNPYTQANPRYNDLVIPVANGVIITSNGDGQSDPFVEKIAAGGRAWRVTGLSPSQSRGHALARDGSLLWCEVGAAQRKVRRMNTSDGSTIWSRAEALMAANGIIVGANRFVLLGEELGKAKHHGRNLSDGSDAWTHTSPLAQGLNPVRAMAQNETKFWDVDNAPFEILMSTGAGTYSGFINDGGNAAGFVLDGSGYRYMLNTSGQLTAYRPNNVVAWSTTLDSGCKGLILAAGMLMSVCNGGLWVAGP